MDDIWDLSVWKVINCALPDNDVGYIVITTTRNADVAKKAGGAYKLKPLSENNSRKLLYRRVFGNENNDNGPVHPAYNPSFSTCFSNQNSVFLSRRISQQCFSTGLSAQPNEANIEDTEKCPDEELAEVSDRILKKCAGVPLAIITMASLLACKARNNMDWYEVYHSIGTGLENNLDVENMRKILSFSYYNMPSHLRTCLLYLSMFPEDYKIEKDRLIWMWIAEGFIQCGKQGKGLFELGEGYFNEIINRSMIQPIYDRNDMVYGCRVHDMVLDLICSLSSEANFVTILNGQSQMSSSSKIRRLSIQNCKEDDSMTLAHRSLQQVRSVVGLSSSLLPVLRSFQLLRAMDLQYCDLSHGYNLNKCLGNLLHLRYLGLRYTRIVELPEEIGNLQFLQILDIQFNKIACLPSNVVQLKHLMCLKMDPTTNVPNGIGRLTSLEELSRLGVLDSNRDVILEELGQLTELRVLHILSDDEWNGKLVEFLHKLQKVQDLNIEGNSYHPSKIDGLDAWVAPQCLCKMEIDGCWFTTLPRWMNPSHVPYLSKLTIAIRGLQQADLDILGKLPALCFLYLKVDHANLGILGGFVVGAGSFPCLITCRFKKFVRPVVFQKGAMPRVRILRSQFYVRGAIEIGRSHGVGLDLGLGLLPSLQDISFQLDHEGANMDEAKELKAMLRHASKIHPNQPSLEINYLQTKRKDIESYRYPHATTAHPNSPSTIGVSDMNRVWHQEPTNGDLETRNE